MHKKSLTPRFWIQLKRHWAKASISVGAIVASIDWVFSRVSWFSNDAPFLLVLDWIKRTPNIVAYMKLAVLWAALFAGVAYLEHCRNKRSDKKERDRKLSVSLLEDDWKPGEGKRTYRIEVQNNCGSAAQNARVQLLSIHPRPSEIQAHKFPIDLPAYSEDRTINPGAKLLFALCGIVTKPGTRVAIFPDQGATFKESMDDMLKEMSARDFGLEYAVMNSQPFEGIRDSDKYWLELLVTAEDRPPTTARLRLRLFASDFDTIGFGIMDGVMLYIVPCPT